VVDVASAELPVDPLAGNDRTPPPLPPNSIEFSVDGISVVADNGNEHQEPGETRPEAPPAPVDPWDHLRPKGEMPPLARRVSIAARVVQTLSVVTAIITLVAGATHFYLNTQLTALNRGDASARTVSDLEQVADAGLLVVAALALLTILAVVGWRWRMRHRGITSGKASAVALFAFLAGGVDTATFYILRRDTVTEAIAANSLIVLGLGLIVAATLILATTVGRLDRRAHK
jgi:hypothetical protein